MINIKVSSLDKNGGLTCSFIIHKAEKESELKMDSESFYKANRPNNDLPPFPHHEIEIQKVSIVSSEEFNNSYSKNLSKLHIREELDSKINMIKYIYWTGNASTEEEALLIIKSWSVGSLWTVINGEDFAKEFPASINITKMKSFAENPYDKIEIKII